jgi:predicted transcriptional regulator
MGDMAAKSSRTAEFPFLSPAEWQVFSILYRRGPLTVRQLVTELEAGFEPARSYTTILTLAQRLTAKGYLVQSEKAAPHGPASAITYSISVSYADALRRHVERFLAQHALDSEDLLIAREVIEKQLRNR